LSLPERVPLICIPQVSPEQKSMQGFFRSLMMAIFTVLISRRAEPEL